MPNDIQLLEPGQPLAFPADLVASAKAYAKNSKASSTQKAYKADWQRFEAWCRSKGQPALPAAPEVVALYLAARADAGRKPATLARELAAICEAHRSAGKPSPRESAGVRAVLKGIRRAKGVAQRQVTPLLPSHLHAISAALPQNLLGLRDRALLLLGFAGAFRRSELVALTVEDLVFTDEGLEVLLRRSKTDQEGQGTKKGVPFGGGPATCPVRSLQAWLATAVLTTGPIFRPITRHGRLGTSALSDRAVALVVKRSADAVGLEPQGFAGHSLRAGLATAAAKAGKPTHAIMKQTGHRSANMVARYVRDAELFADNAAAGIGL